MTSVPQRECVSRERKAPNGEPNGELAPLTNTANVKEAFAPLTPYYRSSKYGSIGHDNEREAHAAGPREKMAHQLKRLLSRLLAVRRNAQKEVSPQKARERGRKGGEH